MAKKRKQVISSNKLGLGENVVLWLMECLTLTFIFHIFEDNYFKYFRLRTLFEVNNILATGVLSKDRLRMCTLIRGKQLQKKGNLVNWNSAARIKQTKKCNFDTGW